MPVTGFDHAAIPAGDPQALMRFYRALGFSVVGEAEWRSGAIPAFALAAGRPEDQRARPKLCAERCVHTPGSHRRARLRRLLLRLERHAREASAAIIAAGGDLIEGPVTRQGGRAGGLTDGTSVYTRDPDGNLVEFIVYD